MPYNDLILDPPRYSAFSRPAATSDSYRIHLVKADDPAYLPPDFEVWPIYHAAILEVLRDYPDVHDAAVEAVKKTTQEIRGLQNRDIPPGTVLRW